MSIQPEKEIVADNNRLANLSYRPRTAPIRGAQAPVPQYGQKMAFYILSNYGDPFSVGLTGMEILNEHGQPISIPFPAGVSVRGGNVERLFSHTKVTMEENEMWLLPLEVRHEIHYRWIKKIIFSRTYVEMWPTGACIDH